MANVWKFVGSRQVSGQWVDFFSTATASGVHYQWRLHPLPDLPGSEESSLDLAELKSSLMKFGLSDLDSEAELEWLRGHPGPPALLH